MITVAYYKEAFSQAEQTLSATPLPSPEHWNDKNDDNNKNNNNNNNDNKNNNTNNNI